MTIVGFLDVVGVFSDSHRDWRARYLEDSLVKERGQYWLRINQRVLAGRLVTNQYTFLGRKAAYRILVANKVHGLAGLGRKGWFGKKRLV